jgi:hypothetical protein
LLDGPRQEYDPIAMFRTALASLLVGCGLLVPAVSRAAPPSSSSPSVYVLTLTTDDVDDQADALTQALRAQVRATPGWTLAETPQSFETLAIALRCPSKPDVACLQRIGDQLHANQYVWGNVNKQGPGHLQVELHLWSRGKPATDASESYGEALRDPNESPLRSLAARLFEQLTGAHATGTLVVHAGTGTGTVWVDGVEREPLVAGVAHISVPVGEHTVAVRVPGSRAPAQAATVNGGDQRDVEFVLMPLAPAPATAPSNQVPAEATEATPPPPSSGGGVRVRSIIGYSSIAVGAGLLVGAGIEGLQWKSDSDQNEKDRRLVPSSVTDVCTDPSPPAQDACKKSRDAKDVSTLGWVFAAAGVVLAGTGTWLVLSDTGKSGATREQSARASGPSFEVIPTVGLHRQGLDVRVKF